MAPRSKYPAHRATACEPVYGQSLTIRPIVAADIDLQRAFWDDLSTDTRYNRFFGAGARPTPAQVERLTDVDYEDHMAFVATMMFDDGEREIGVARYVRTEPGAAEFAIVVADAWQGAGIGRRLMAALVDTARAAGLVTLYGDVFSSNTAMLAFMDRLGFAIGPHPDEGATVRRVTLDLRQPGPHPAYDAALAD